MEFTLEEIRVIDRALFSYTMILEDGLEGKHKETCAKILEEIKPIKDKIFQEFIKVYGPRI